VSDRDLSVVVLGATGITGRQVAAYLAQRAAESEIHWAVAGREPAKIEHVLGKLGVTAPETLRADLDDPAALEEIASRARVVLNLVGPYSRYGEPVIQACIAAGTHYADLTGEIPFVRRMIDAHQQEALEAGVKIVNVSGFEALPADLAVLLSAETARHRWSEELETVSLSAHISPSSRMLGVSGLVSGGTLQSLAEAFADKRSGLIADPAALLTDAGDADRVRRANPMPLAPWFDADGEAIGPMTPVVNINPPVIHRTAALRAAEEGLAFEPFHYREGMALSMLPTMPLRYATAGLTTASLIGTSALARTPAVVRRSVAMTLRKALPGSGFGPTGEGLEGWSWRLGVDATTANGHRVRVDGDGDGHPGYLSTARMLGEAGLLLAEEGATPERTGFVTPAAALGAAQIDRFQRAGMRLRVSS
jgi:short subunit dehydrogenase-like uncharacterized protein